MIHIKCLTLFPLKIITKTNQKSTAAVVISALSVKILHYALGIDLFYSLVLFGINLPCSN